MIKWDLQRFAEKTEPATAKKRGEMKGKGQVAHSMDLPMAFSLLSILIGLRLFGGGLLQALYNSTRMLLSDGTLYAARNEGLSSAIWNSIDSVFSSLIPIIIIGLAAGVITSVAQTGIIFTPSVIIPDITRINPITGMQRFFTLNSFMEFIKSSIKITIVGIVSYVVLSGIAPQLFQIDQGDPVYILNFYLQNAFKLLITVSVVYVVIALADLFYQRFSFERSIRMSKDEIKDEQKQSDGNPQVKSKIRERGRAIAFRRMMQKVPTADVVITNPTHYAIALRYDALTMHAPQVIAKGVDHAAKRIREIAEENDVIVVENRQLARTLYNVVEIDEYVPGSLFAAVAEVLAYVYRLRGKIQN